MVRHKVDVPLKHVARAYSGFVYMEKRPLHAEAEETDIPVVEKRDEVIKDKRRKPVKRRRM